MFAVDLLMGVWTVWLNSAITLRYGPGLKTAVVAGLAWWIIKTLQSAKWVGLGLVSLDAVLAPLVVSFVSAVISAMIGVWLYERTAKPSGNRLD